jgi:Tol biopolymer transport system component
MYLAMDAQGALTLFWKLGEGSGQVNRLAEVKPHAALFYPWSIAPDGQTLTYFELNPETGWDIGRLSLEGEPRKQILLATRFAEVQPQISRDGNWLAYVSNESGQYEVYVSPFPDVESGKWRVSNGGGRQPVWSPDGRELFYQDGGSLLAVSVEVTPAFSVGNPQPLFSGPYRHSGNFFTGHTYDIAPDGEKFLMIRNSGIASNHINIVLNWFEDLKRLVPTDR